MKTPAKFILVFMSTAFIFAGGAVLLATKKPVLKQPTIEQVALRPSPPVSPSPKITVEELHAEINKERVKAGLGALALRAALNDSAQAKCQDMVIKDYWSHNAPDGTPPWVFFSKPYRKAGENLAFGFQTSESVVIGWMNSKTHRDNILDPVFTDEGFAICDSPNFIGRGKQTIVAQHLSL